MAALTDEHGNANDMVLLDNASTDAVVDLLQKRFKNYKPYTYIGEVVVSVNPYKSLNIYNDRDIEEYKGREQWEKQPHLFALAEAVHQTIKRLRRNTCVIITGESGSGKTEASKIIMKYLAAVTSHGAKNEIERVRSILLRTNVILESFGNAKTGRNDNSSRFGKYMDISFDFRGTPNGGNINSYLLEKSRVVKRNEGERNFHSFYQLLSGASEQQLSALSLKRDVSAYRYTRPDGSQSSQVDGLDDRKLFKDVEQAMKSVGFENEEVNSIWSLMAAILHLGNVDFTPDGDTATISNKDLVNRIAKLLSTDVESVSSALTTRTVSAGGDVIAAQHTAEIAEYSRDALAKAIYDRLFASIVKRINSQIQVDQRMTDCVIGVLDIYGFEVLGVNSFEQLCINYANEMLQQLFIRLVIKEQQEEYVREQIEWVNIEYHNNEPICQLVESKNGMLTLLEDAAGGGLGKATDQNLLEALDKRFGQNNLYSSRRKDPQDKTLEHGHQFRIKHYAGDVTYSIIGFIDKSKDLVFQDFKRLLYNSKNKVISGMWKDGAQSVSVVTKRPPAAGTLFKQSMQELVKNLASKDPYYVRCVKPNEIKSAQRFDFERVKHQVAYLGLVENIRVRKAGFAIRQPYDRFLARYKMICSATWPNHRMDSDRTAAKRLNSDMGIKEGVDLEYGRTKLFIRSAQTINKLEVRRTEVINHLVIFLQKHWRGTLQRIRYKKMIASLKIMAFYRKYKLRAYMKDLDVRFRNVRQMEDRGKSISWGSPPKSIIATVDYFKLVFRRWQAHFVLISYPKEIHPDIKLRCGILDTFQGKRTGWQNGNWSGDYCSDDPNFTSAVNALRTKQSIGKVLFAGRGMKLSKGAKSSERIIVVSENFVIKIDPNKKYKVMEKEPFSVISGISIFNFQDSKVAIIHCTTRNDLVLILSSGNVVDCVARLAAKKVKINLLEQIPFQFEKKTLTLTRDNSPTQQPHFQKNVNAIVAFE